MTGWGKFGILVVAVLIVEVHSYRKDWGQKWKRCERIRCDPSCRTVPGEDGCLKCECAPLCSPPKCDPGCEVQKVFDGPCPGCECKDIGIDEVPLERICEPVKCGAPCKEVIPELPGECPKCVCDENEGFGPSGIVCDPPKCPRGCSIEKIYDGPCPGCDCKEKKDEGLIPGGIVCDPPRCPRGCSIEKVYDGPCPGCDCKEKKINVPRTVQCSPPKCPPGCIIQKVFDGPCPGCDCPEDDIEEEKKCPKLEKECHEPGCKIEKDEDGCDICECKPQCTPPKCRRWCRVKQGEDGCPICDCKIRWKHKRD